VKIFEIDRKREGMEGKRRIIKKPRGI